MDLLKQLNDHHLRIFTTADVITLTRLAPAAATHMLRRLAAQRILASLKRGIWANRLAEELDPMEAVSHLTAPWPSYVSLYSALSRQGLIDEVPQAVYVVTSGRSAQYAAPLGEFRVHHLPHPLFWGFQTEHSDRATFLMAEPEKAFLDLAYLGLIPRSPLGMPYKRDGKWRLDRAKLTRYAKRFHFPPLVAYLKKKKLYAIS